MISRSYVKYENKTSLDKFYQYMTMLSDWRMIAEAFIKDLPSLHFYSINYKAY